MSKPLLKIPRSQQYSITMMLLKKQGGLCAVCNKSINVQTRGRSSDYALDHCHSSGEVRGVLHRSCNAAEGKVRHAVSRWGSKGNDEEAILSYLEGLVLYLRAQQAGELSTGLMYPDHKTDEQKSEAAKLKRRKQYATKKAAAAVKQRKQSGGT